MGTVNSIGTVVWIYRQKLISAVMFMLVWVHTFLSGLI